MTRPPELLPCPFCGCDAQFVHNGTTDGAWVQCMDPNCWAETRYMDTIKEAAEQWNKRVPVTTLSAYQDDNDASLVAIRIADGDVTVVETINALIIESIGGYCPCQAEGTMNGYPFYFRARHGDWQLDVAEVGGDPVEASIPDDPALYRAEGDDPWDGYMPVEAAKILIQTEYIRFSAQMGLVPTMEARP